MKERVREEAKMNLVDFGERLKFQYLFPLVDGLGAGLEAHLDDLLKSLLADLEGVMAAMRQAGEGQESRRQSLEALAQRVKAVDQELSRLGGRLNIKNNFLKF